MKGFLFPKKPKTPPPVVINVPTTVNEVKDMLMMGVRLGFRVVANGLHKVAQFFESRG